MGTTWPKSWMDTADWVRAQEACHIAPTKLYTAMREKGVQEPDTLADYLHDLGDILYRHNHDLDDLVILDASWVARHISRVLASDRIHHDAICTKPMMKDIWCKANEQVRKLFLRLMHEFDLSYRIDDPLDISLVVEKHEKLIPVHLLQIGDVQQGYGLIYRVLLPKIYGQDTYNIVPLFAGAIRKIAERL